MRIPARASTRAPNARRAKQRVDPEIEDLKIFNSFYSTAPWRVNRFRRPPSSRATFVARPASGRLGEFAGMLRAQGVRAARGDAADKLGPRRPRPPPTNGTAAAVRGDAAPGSRRR
jgi:hypothetical protein